jgi:hypothetical protein
MFNLIARQIDRVRLRATLRTHRQSAETSGVLWIRKSRFESFLASHTTRSGFTASRVVVNGPPTSSGGACGSLCSQVRLRSWPSRLYECTVLIAGPGLSCSRSSLPSWDSLDSFGPFPIVLGTAVELFRAAMAAEGSSPRTVEWYRMVVVRAIRRFGQARPVRPCETRSSSVGRRSRAVATREKNYGFVYSGLGFPSVHLLA